MWLWLLPTQTFEDRSTGHQDREDPGRARVLDGAEAVGEEPLPVNIMRKPPKENKIDKVHTLKPIYCSNLSVNMQHSLLQ